jgi:hypothetical protein
MLSKEREKEILDQYHRDKAIREQEQKEADDALANFYAIMAARNQPRVVTVAKSHRCSTCGVIIQKGETATYTPGRIAARSSRNTDACFTASTYTCKSCHELTVNGKLAEHGENKQ